MNRLAGIICAVVGLIVIVLGVVKILPGLTGTGVGLLLLGILMIGLSFVPGPEQDGTPRMSTAATLGNIFVSPSEVFQNLRRHPRWLVVILVTTILGSVFHNLFIYHLGAERVANYAIDKTLEMPMMNDEARKGIEAGRADAIAENTNPLRKAGQAVTSFVGLTYWTAFVALVFFLFAMAMGGKINYWQAFSVAAYAAFPIAFIRYVLGSVILFLKDPVDIHPLLGQGTMVQENLGVLINPGTNPVLYTLLSFISLLWFYWIFLNVTGLKNGGERVTPVIAWSATLTIYLLLLCLLLVMALAFPSFMS